MEFAFQETTFSHLQLLADEWIRQEELADIIVPDSYPDAVQIVDSFASVTVRSKECRNGSILISGGINAGLLYLAEQEQTPRLLETYLPFSIKKDLDGCDEQTQAVVICHCAGTDGRIINSRKVMLRVNLSCNLQAFQSTQQSEFEPGEVDPRLQLHRQSYPLLLPAEVGEKLFNIEEELELPSGKPAIAKILHFDLRPQVAEAKIAGDKAVFKGELWLRVLYQSPESQIEEWVTQVPYSQYCELVQSYEEENFQIHLLLSTVELTPNGQPESQILNLSVMMAAQCIVYRTQMLDTIDDAYWLGGELQAQMHPYNLRCILQRQQQTQTVRVFVSGQVKSIADVQLFLSQPEIEIGEKSAVIRLPVLVLMCYQDGEGNYHAAREQAQAVFEQPAGENTACQAFAELGSDLYAMPGPDGAEIRFGVNLSCNWNVRCNFETIRSIETKDAQDNGDARPSVIVRTLERDMSVWQLAKEINSTTERICSANGISEDLIRAGTLLLMPLA